MEFIDQMENRILVDKNPSRIISLVPSITELLFDLGLDEEIVGITRFCVAPESKVKNKTSIGGTKNFQFDRIDNLKPDLIIGNKEENYFEGITKLQKSYPVWMSDIVSLKDALFMIKAIGRLTNKKIKSEELINEIKREFEKMEVTFHLKAVYLIWKDPCMVAGGNTFINSMLTICGFINIFEKIERYPTVSTDQLEKADVILLPSEPFPFKEKDADTIREIFPSKRIILVDGTMFSWYGSRLLNAADYYKTLRKSILDT